MSQNQAKVSPGEDDNKNKPQDLEALENGPIDKRGCTDIFCCLLYLASIGALIHFAVLGWTTGKPEYLTAVFSASGKACKVDFPDLPYLYFPIPHPDYLNHTTCVKECPVYDTVPPSSLICETNVFVKGCSSFCSPLDLVGTNPTGWNQAALLANIQNLFCIYNTTVLLDRICMPGEAALFAVKSLQAKLNSRLSMDLLSKWFGDLTISWPIIAGSVGIALGLGLFYMLFVRLFSGIIVWVCILLYFAALCALGALCYLKSKDLKDALDIQGQAPNTQPDGVFPANTNFNQVYTYEYLGYTLWGIAGISLIGFLCMIRNIRLAIAIIKCATGFVAQTPLVMLVPPFFTILTAGFWTFWIFGAIYLWSVGTVQKLTGYPIATIIHDKNTQYYLWYFLFGGLWSNAFFQACCQFVLASTVCIWYFGQGTGTVHRPISRSIYRAIRYHIGSIAFGAFLLAVVQFLRILLEYFANQAKKTGADKNKLIKFLISCLRCYLACFERFIRFLNKYAYIQIALSGRNFCSAAKEAMRMLWANPTRVMLVGGLGGAFVLIGKLFIVVADVIICYELLLNIEPYKSSLTSVILPCLLIFVIGYAIAQVFMSVYGMATDSILMCFLYDEEQQRGKGNQAPAHCPPLLQDFFEKHEKKDDKKEEK